MPERDGFEGETHRVLGGNGRVREVTKHGLSKDVQELVIEEKGQQRYGGLGGQETIVKQRYRKRSTVLKGNAWFTLQALADYFNMELTEK